MGSVAYSRLSSSLVIVTVGDFFKIHTVMKMLSMIHCSFINHDPSRLLLSSDLIFRATQKPFPQILFLFRFHAIKLSDCHYAIHWVIVGFSISSLLTASSLALISPTILPTHCCSPTCGMVFEIDPFECGILSIDSTFVNV